MSHFQEILNTIGATNIVVIRDNIKWGMWQVEYSTPLVTVTGYYLYLKHKCRKNEATQRNLNSWKLLSKKSPYDL